MGTSAKARFDQWEYDSLISLQPLQSVGTLTGICPGGVTITPMLKQLAATVSIEDSDGGGNGGGDFGTPSTTNVRIVFSQVKNGSEFQFDPPRRNARFDELISHPPTNGAWSARFTVRVPTSGHWSVNAGIDSDATISPTPPASGDYFISGATMSFTVTFPDSNDVTMLDSQVNVSFAMSFLFP